jgi:imidazole glycerol-phosphate synthase subunit HisH
MRHGIMRRPEELARRGGRDTMGRDLERPGRVGRVMIAIIDYGMGNLRSVQKALEAVGQPAEVTSDPDRIRAADKVVLPGVGAFADAIAELRRTGLGEAFRDAVAAGKPCLGVCLGLQLLFDLSEEDGLHEGLGLLPGRVVRFTPAPGLKVPHMGWNTLRVLRPVPLLKGLEPDPSVYFVHSYYAVPADPRDVAAEADHGNPFAALVWRDNLMACQFHPEKSQRVGLAMYANFARL